MTTTPEIVETPRQRMSGLHLALLVIGVLLSGGMSQLFREPDHFWLALAGVVVATPLILFGAHGLGRSIRLDSPGAATDASYPARLEGQLDPALSRGLWLVKWLLAIPHYIVLAILWTAFPVVVLASAIMILFTGRYPRGFFEYVVGVLRWSWRVTFYATGVLATDKYPPFTLARTDFAATFDVDYPERLNRGLVLVKSWLLALPHLLIIGLLSGSFWFASDGPASAGLVGLLVFIAAIGLLFTGAYLRGLFDLVMGIHRWVYRVFAYTSLLRDEYPPFRLDQGAAEQLAD
ncbi:uncharacterized protein DUF4389 [Homoserinimonas aerilata]|uniref:Uncharacterized protein DUF4389 n=1 Tax=Homoserinimonas aerilata TaxID=1162970 RepID=A0A542YGZ4_9MICO|nr:uncharacterized protein DUF4389 [Homoserinimonas aerilata]